MIAVTQLQPHRLSLEERILAMSPETIATTLPRTMLNQRARPSKPKRATPTTGSAPPS